MALFSKSNKNIKDEKVAFTLSRLMHNGKEELRIIAIISLESLLNKVLSAPDIQMLWNDIKELYGKDVDEKELHRVFKFFALMNTLAASLEETIEFVLPPKVISDIKGWGYDIYINKDFFDGKLDKKTFKELAEKIWTYYYGDFLKKHKQNKEQKDEQPK